MTDFETRAAQLRKVFQGTPRNSRGYRIFSASQRAEAIALARAGHTLGKSNTVIGALVGLSDGVLGRWLHLSEAAMASPSLPKRVRLVEQREESQPAKLLVSGPAGLRIEGLGIAELAQLLKALS